MKNLKLLDTADALSDAEYKKFGEYLDSPYFNKSIINRKVYIFLKKFRGRQTISDPVSFKTKLFGYLYKGKKYDDKSARKAISNLNIALDNFIILQSFESQTNNKLPLLEFYQTRGLPKYFLSLYRDLTRQVNDLSSFDTVKYERKIELQNSYDNYCSAYGIHDLEPTLYELGYATNYLFIYNKLIQFTETNYMYKHATETIKIPGDFKEEMLTILAADLSQIKKDHPGIYIQYLALKIEETDEPQYFYKLKEYLFKNYSLLDLNVIVMIFTTLTNFLIRAINQEDTKFLKEHIEISKFTVEKTNMFKEGRFHYNQFLDIVINAIRVKETDWTESFIKKYCIKIQEPYRERVYYFSLSKVYIERGQYEHAIELLNKIKTDEYHFYLLVKGNTVKLYYELGLFEHAMDILNSMKQYILRNAKVSKSYKERFSPFIKYMYIIIKLNFNPDDHKLHTLIKKLEKDNAATHREWMTVKLRELQRGVKLRA